VLINPAGYLRRLTLTVNGRAITMALPPPPLDADIPEPPEDVPPALRRKAARNG
jgi:hypothetical protein